MSGESDLLVKVLLLVVMLFVFLLFILIGVLFYINYKSKNEQKKNEKEEYNQKKSKVQESYSVQSIFNFMEFDKVEDNMIVLNKGKKYLMVVKCQGINFDLMSEIEKVSVEQGFLQYLNTLRHQIQIYVQTRTVDLSSSLTKYKEKIKVLGANLQKKQLDYNQYLRNGDYTQEQLNVEQREIIKARNLYEYGVDIVNNTERMSLNKNILSKQYYIIIPYYSEEIGTGDYSKDEIQNMAFSELYTRAQSTISLLSVCGIVGKILDSIEISNLLYMAYNRDEAEIYDMQKAINARYDEMYTTAPDVLDKKMRALDLKIEEEALKRANEAILEVKQENEKEKAIKQKEQEFEEAVKSLAKLILDENRSTVGIKTVENAKQKIDIVEKDNSKEKEEISNGKEKSTVARRVGRPRKNS